MPTPNPLPLQNDKNIRQIMFTELLNPLMQRWEWSTILEIDMLPAVTGCDNVCYPYTRKIITALILDEHREILLLKSENKE